MNSDPLYDEIIRIVDTSCRAVQEKDVDLIIEVDQEISEFIKKEYPVERLSQFYEYIEIINENVWVMSEILKEEIERSSKEFSLHLKGKKNIKQYIKVKNV